MSTSLSHDIHAIRPLSSSRNLLKSSMSYTIVTPYELALVRWYDIKTTEPELYADIQAIETMSGAAIPGAIPNLPMELQNFYNSLS
ncbi:15510_t:CDS:2 [Rhizophagus irregularis]|nr:15510_t:CDS:2 [Rhizophagus irregularis]